MGMRTWQADEAELDLTTERGREGKEESDLARLPERGRTDSLRSIRLYYHRLKEGGRGGKYYLL